jgi:hypothetical protein
MNLKGMSKDMKCRMCGKENAKYQDKLTKDWWHKRCHNKIKKLPFGINVDFFVLETRLKLSKNYFNPRGISSNSDNFLYC